MKWLRHPIRSFQEKQMAIFIGSILRHALTASGVGGVLSDNEYAQAAGAIATLVGILWSVVPKVIAAQKAA